MNISSILIMTRDHVDAWMLEIILGGAGNTNIQVVHDPEDACSLMVKDRNPLLIVDRESLAALAGDFNSPLQSQFSHIVAILDSAAFSMAPDLLRGVPFPFLVKPFHPQTVRKRIAGLLKPTDPWGLGQVTRTITSKKRTFPFGERMTIIRNGNVLRLEGIVSGRDSTPLIMALRRFFQEDRRDLNINMTKLTGMNHEVQQVLCAACGLLGRQGRKMHCVNPSPTFQEMVRQRGMNRLCRMAARAPWGVRAVPCLSRDQTFNESEQ